MKFLREVYASLFLVHDYGRMVIKGQYSNEGHFEKKINDARI